MRRGIFLVVILVAIVLAWSAYDKLSVSSLREAQRTHAFVEERDQTVPVVAGASVAEAAITNPAKKKVVENKQASSTSTPEAQMLNLRIEIENKKLEIDQKIQEMADVQRIREDLNSQRENNLQAQGQAAQEALTNANIRERQVLEQYGGTIQQEINGEADQRTQLESNISQLRSSLQTQNDELRNVRINNPTLTQAELETMQMAVQNRIQSDQAQLSLYEQELRRLGSETSGRVQQLEASRRSDLANIHLQKQAIQAEVRSLSEQDRKLDESEFQTRIRAPETRFSQLQDEIKRDRQALQKMEGELRSLQPNTTVIE